MTHDLAEQILVGHFHPEDHRHSWLVAAGSNPAYEQFALQCSRLESPPLMRKQVPALVQGLGSEHLLALRQHVLQMMVFGRYHPTFLVEALDGAKIWRTRDYRVRRKEMPLGPSQWRVAA